MLGTTAEMNETMTTWERPELFSEEFRAAFRSLR